MAAAKAQGSDLASWRRPVLCAKGSGLCDQIEPLTAGAVDTPPQPWQNRGTFHQAVEILHGPAYLGQPRGTGTTPGPVRSLPATGLAPGEPEAGLACLVAAALWWSRRRTMTARQTEERR